MSLTIMPFNDDMPLILSRPDDEARMAYLKALFTEVYVKDIVERKKITRIDALSDILDLLCSSVGLLTNPNNVANAINSIQKLKSRNHIAPNAVKTDFCKSLN